MNDANSHKEQHWSEQQEIANPLGIRILLFCYRYGGLPLFWLLACPVVLYYFLLAGKARRASLDYLRLLHIASDGKTPKSSWWNSYRHLLSFAQNLLEKFSAWIGGVTERTVQFPQRDVFTQLQARQQGAVLFISHLGNTEMCRVLSMVDNGARLNILVHTRHAESFNKLLEKVNGHRQVELLEVTELDAAVAAMLSQRVANGELLAIAADRTPVGVEGRRTQANFLGRTAPFPQGPYILAALLKCPVYSLFCLRQKKGYRVYIEHFAEQLVLPRGARQSALAEYAQQYADRLSHYCQQAPLQWYNFFDFWQGSDSREH
ncbi:hypothetical protein QSV34_00655 [Porticoccus sp. W117]|uniref:LpxL/LpxP family acyltransferase n=1 Tax=Porticoccus sp. W117 TaxID=3054777 RepID=UPI0025972675|nr:hypothetical protein [Porticoccus sp. W117]MDM3869853.1 hypothetical protein [Porticoccus sp. W117]